MAMNDVDNYERACCLNDLCESTKLITSISATMAALQPELANPQAEWAYYAHDRLVLKFMEVAGHVKNNVQRLEALRVQDTDQGGDDTVRGLDETPDRRTALPQIQRVDMPRRGMSPVSMEINEKLVLAQRIVDRTWR